MAAGSGTQVLLPLLLSTTRQTACARMRDYHEYESYFLLSLTGESQDLSCGPSMT